MDKSTPREETPTKPAKSAHIALGVLALCFALSVLGRGLGESFTVFLLPISENFGWDSAQVVSVYSLTALAGGLATPLMETKKNAAGSWTESPARVSAWQIAVWPSSQEASIQI